MTRVILPLERRSTVAIAAAGWLSLADGGMETKRFFLCVREK